MTRPGFPALAAERSFDGIICIGGEDWWYHNRGHFDFQILRRLAHDWPVLYVNSIGVRFPSPRLGGRFVAKVARKLKSFSRGLTHVENRFWVLSPLTPPGAANAGFLGKALAAQVRLQAMRMGIRRPLVWMHCPAGAGFLDALRPVGTVLQRTDRFESFPEGNPDVLGRAIAHLKRRADLVVYCNDELMRQEADQVRASVMVTHGVEFERFAAAGRATRTEPGDMAGISRPRVGFTGGIDHHTFDPELFRAIAQALPWVQFVLVGGSSLPDGWCPLPNVHALGRRPYDDIAGYMAANDVLIMPWNASEWIKACNPVKLKEYLAVGRPIVTTDFPALGAYRELVTVAGDASSFVRGIESALTQPFDAERSRQAVAAETWDAKASFVRQAIGSQGFAFAERLTGAAEIADAPLGI